MFLVNVGNPGGGSSSLEDVMGKMSTERVGIVVVATDDGDSNAVEDAMMRLCARDKRWERTSRCTPECVNKTPRGRREEIQASF